MLKELETRRKFIKQGLGLLIFPLVIACRPNQSTPQPEVSKETTIIRSEVARLVQFWDPDTVIRKIYTGGVFPGLDPIFTLPVPTGFSEGRGYSLVHAAGNVSSPTTRFEYFPQPKGGKVALPTPIHHNISIMFSRNWLNTKDDRLKRLAIEKETLYIGLWNPFSTILKNSYAQNGPINKLDATVTDQEIANAMAIYTLGTEPGIRKIYDFAGYLVILPKVGQLLSLNDPKFTQEIESYTNLKRVYDAARAKNIPFDKVGFNSREFYQLAFDPNSPWAQMVADRAFDLD